MTINTLAILIGVMMYGSLGAMASLLVAAPDDRLMLGNGYGMDVRSRVAMRMLGGVVVVAMALAIKAF